MAKSPCKYKLKGTDNWFKSKEALATSLNVTPGLKDAVARFEKEVGKTDMESVTSWLEKQKTNDTQNIEGVLKNPEIIRKFVDENFQSIVADLKLANYLKVKC